MIQNLIDIFTAPSAVFARLKEKPTLLFPLLLVIALTASVQTGYVLMTDSGFLADQVIEQSRANNPNLSEQQEETIRSAYSNATLLAVAAAVGTLVVVPLVYALYAVYLNFVSKFSFVEFGWKAWMSLLAWTSIPGCLTVLASWAALLSNRTGQLPMTDLNPLSFAYLFGMQTNGPLTQLSIVQLWSFALLAMGYRQWTGKSMLMSAVLALTPYVVIYGIWIALTL